MDDLTDFEVAVRFGAMLIGGELGTADPASPLGRFKAIQARREVTPEELDALILEGQGPMYDVPVYSCALAPRDLPRPEAGSPAA